MSCIVCGNKSAFDGKLLLRRLLQPLGCNFSCLLDTFEQGRRPLGAGLFVEARNVSVDISFELSDLT